MKAKYVKSVTAIVLMIILIVSSTSCNSSTLQNNEASDTSSFVSSDALKKHNKELANAIEEYKKTSSNDILANIIVSAMDGMNYDVLQKYGEKFFCCDENDENILFESYGKYLKQYVPDSTKDDIIEMYDITLCEYICTYFYDLTGMKEVYYGNDNRIYSVLEKALPLFMDTSIMGGSFSVAVKYFPETEKLIDRLTGGLNLFSINAPEELSSTANLCLSQIFSETKSDDMHNFYLMLFALKNTNKSVKVHDNNQNGKINEVNDINVIKRKINSLFNNNDSDVGYDDITETFGCVPKAFSGDKAYWLCFYTDSYTITFFGAPAYAYSVSDSVSGKLLLYYTKDINKINKG